MEGQQLLHNSKVLVIGAGGLGCPCLLALAGAGIGTLGIADFDYVSVSNLHRQHLYLLSDEGKKKAAIAKERLTPYNPFIQIKVHDVYVQLQNILPLFQQYDIVIDCTDNFVARYLINDACVFLHKPLVYGAIHRAEGQVTVFNWNGSATLRCLFPGEGNDTTQSCSDIGAYNIITGIVGLMMANETIKLITHQPGVFVNTLVSFDALTGKTTQLQYQLNNQSLVISHNRFNNRVAKSE